MPVTTVFYYSEIILIKLATLYSQNYAGIIGASLIPDPKGFGRLHYR